MTVELTGPIVVGLKQIVDAATPMQIAEIIANWSDEDQSRCLVCLEAMSASWGYAKQDMRLCRIGARLEPQVVALLERLIAFAKPVEPQ